MKLKSAIRNQPFKPLLSISIFIGTLAIILWRFDKRFGNSFEDQSILEQFVRLIFGSMVLFLPQILIYGVVYWLMYKVKRPTIVKFNTLHIYLLFGSISIQLLATVIFWFSATSNSFGIGFLIFEYLIAILNLGIVAIFIVNIIQSVRRRHTHIEESVPIENTIFQEEEE